MSFPPLIPNFEVDLGFYYCLGYYPLTGAEMTSLGRSFFLPYKMHAESWELDLNSEFRVLAQWISVTLSSPCIIHATQKWPKRPVGKSVQHENGAKMQSTVHAYLNAPPVLSARTRDCRRRPDLIARAENHNSTQPGCHVASRTRSTDLQKMTWYFRSFPVRG